MNSAEIMDSAASLLSLSIAAANAVPIPVSQNSAAAPISSSSVGSHAVTSKVHSALKHRRMSSSGQVKRRMSDAREAASRPSAASLSSGTAALNALATLSLAGSPPPQAPPQTSTSFASAVGTIRFNPSEATDEQQVKQEEHDAPGTVANEVSAGGITVKNGNGKKRGTTYQCESCSKLYRHPSCLIKHRWEHTPHWREASKLMLSKHQQVQLLEAAAILSHIAPPGEGGTSLPEDRSLWPSFLSGGLLPPPTGAQPPSTTVQVAQQPYRVSSSVPTQSALSVSRPASAGPRLHDYAITTANGITHVRPGVVGVSTGNSPAHTPAPQPVPLPVNRTAYRDMARGMSVSSDVLESPISSAIGQQSYGTTGSWSLPRSSVRSRSTSAPKSEEDENAALEVDIEGEEPYVDNYGFISRGRHGGWKDDEYTKNLQEEKIEEEWDGEMEMEM
ncbi:hypothetical protein BDY19DRAFT_936581 [Irpex rosettiformis]|uniref:Uncharacterized protein n=1 Tax=Irpex rosettiformis TaxID=378272 RepID=A0ACB8U8M2_9APHY|nr:hypothetical protein BDY19DRAFT_936581 [Irpex rosettiformis]